MCGLYKINTNLHTHRNCGVATVLPSMDSAGREGMRGREGEREDEGEGEREDERGGGGGERGGSIIIDCTLCHSRDLSGWLANLS